ncbi:MAG: AI-2E family transporter [Candidatus Campbellbacteria bacterium]
MQNMTIHISASSVLKALLVLVGAYVLYLLKDIVLIVLAAVVIASAVEPATRWFVRYKLPRAAAVVVVYIGIALGLIGLVYFLLPSLLSETAAFFALIPEYVGAIDFKPILERFFDVDSASTVQGLSDTISANDFASATRSLLAIPGGAFRVVATVFGGVFSFALVIVLSFYLSVQEDGIPEFLRLITPHRHHAYVLDLWKRSQRKIGQWMQGQLLLMLLVGLLVFLGLTILDIRHAFLFAIMAGLFELIPLFGPILASIPAIAVALSQGGLTLTVMVIGLYIIIQQFENHLLYPLVVNKVVGVPAIVVILALIVGAQLAGFLGALLSVPLAAVLMELVHDAKKRSVAAS